MPPATWYPACGPATASAVVQRVAASFGAGLNVRADAPPPSGGARLRSYCFERPAQRGDSRGGPSRLGHPTLPTTRQPEHETARARADSSIVHQPTASPDRVSSPRFSCASRHFLCPTLSALTRIEEDCAR